MELYCPLMTYIGEIENLSFGPLTSLLITTATRMQLTVSQGNYLHVSIFGGLLQHTSFKVVMSTFFAPWI